MASTGTALLVFAGIVSFSLPVWALVDLLQWSQRQWTRAGHDRTRWAALVIFAWVPGAIAYALAVRPRLARPQPRLANPPPGWYPDPKRTDRHRYHDGSVWTRFVVQRS